MATKMQCMYSAARDYLSKSLKKLGKLRTGNPDDEVAINICHALHSLAHAVEEDSKLIHDRLTRIENLLRQPTSPKKQEILVNGRSVGKQR